MQLAAERLVRLCLCFAFRVVHLKVNAALQRQEIAIQALRYHQRGMPRAPVMLVKLVRHVSNATTAVIHAQAGVYEGRAETWHNSL